jgi:hypothetical protein
MVVHIVYPVAIVYDIAVPVTAAYSVQWTIVGIQGIVGSGSWGDTWNLGVDQGGATLQSEHPLVGSGSFLASHLPMSFRFRARLVVRIVPAQIIPFPTDDPTEGVWEGVVTMSGCQVDGYLFRTDSTTLFPGYYRVRGEYVISPVQSNTGDSTQRHVNVHGIRISGGT